jgi:hypothetical protein
VWLRPNFDVICRVRLEKEIGSVLAANRTQNVREDMPTERGKERRKHMKIINITILIFVSITLFFVSTCSAGWVVFHKPEYRGRIIDADTKKPIEGVVIVAIYNTEHIINGPGGGSSSIINIRETLTDVKGEFVIPSYWSVMGLNTIEYDTEFIIYKPGYGSYPNNSIYPLKYYNPEYLFSKKLDKEGDVRYDLKILKIKFGVAELPRLKTKEERLNAAPSEPTDWGKSVPLLLAAINEERKSFGLNPIEPFGKY